MMKISKFSKSVVAGATVLASTVLSAAPVTIDAAAQADVTDSVANGGAFLIAVTLSGIAFIALARIVKRA